MQKDIILENLKGFLRKGATSNVTDYVPTGHFNLDFCINHGVLPDTIDLSKLDGYDPTKCLGLPMGRLVEVFGEEGGGKSSLGYRIIGNGQKKDLKCGWIDTELSFSDNLAIINGVDKEELYYADMSNIDKPDVTFCAEDVFDAICEMIKNGVKVIVLDSVANMMPRAQLERKAAEIKKIVNYAGKFGALVVFINQVRDQIGSVWGNPETTPGGRALKFNASVRLQITLKKSKEANIFREEPDGSETLIGRTANVHIRKNRMAKPFFEPILVPVYFEPYFPNIEERLFDFGRQLQMISVRLGAFNWKQANGKVHKVDGKFGFIKYIETENLSLPLARELVDASKESKVLVPPEISIWIRDAIANNKVDVFANTKENANESSVEEDGTDDNAEVEKLSTRGRKKKDT
jgi:recombination protein RecA